MAVASEEQRETKSSGGLLGLVIAGSLCFCLVKALPAPRSALSDYALQGSPTISATYIDQVLCDNGSPACGTGAQLYNDGVAAGIDPAIALAFFDEESSYGTYGVAASTKSLGNIRCTTSEDQCVDGFQAYVSWDAGYRGWYGLMEYYVDQLHEATVDEVIPTYAPSTENDTTSYVANVESSVDLYRSQSK